MTTGRQAARDDGSEPPPARRVDIRRIGADFTRWDAVLALILRAFAPMRGRIDPPSSAWRMTPGDLCRTAANGPAFLAVEAGTPVGCVFCRVKGDALYLGKLAVEPRLQGRGIGSALVAAAGREAAAQGLAWLELQTRVELVENHAAFAALGFVKVGETAIPATTARPA